MTKKILSDVKDKLVLIENSDNVICIKLQGDIIHYNSEEPLKALLRYMQNNKNIVLQNCGINQWDSSLLLFLFGIIKLAKTYNVECDISSLPTNLQNLMELAFAVKAKQNNANRLKNGFLEIVGEYAIKLWKQTS